jgi:hypothetical protein
MKLLRKAKYQKKLKKVMKKPKILLKMEKILSRRLMSRRKSKKVMRKLKNHLVILWRTIRFLMVLNRATKKLKWL